MLSELEDSAGKALSDSAQKGLMPSNAAAAKPTSATTVKATVAVAAAPAVESITRKDVIGALKSLMVAAGLPMSMDQERLAESVMQLKASIAEERCDNMKWPAHNLIGFSHAKL
jgi:hypothetical protein